LEDDTERVYLSQFLIRLLVKVLADGGAGLCGSRVSSRLRWGTMAVELRLVLLGGFGFWHGGREIIIATSGQRLVALLALYGRPLSRVRAAGILWPEYSARRSLGNLRTALWRVNQACDGLILVMNSAIALRDDVRVDVDRLKAFAGNLSASGPGSKPVDLNAMTLQELAADLLPDWYEEWVQDDRESVRQLRLHALEDLAGALCQAGRHNEGIQAALAAIRLEPLRESAHRTLLNIHLLEGNWFEARRHYERCKRLFIDELGVGPSESISCLLESVPPARAALKVAAIR
jgi:DNA-binding SARP family transcriptional activator